MLQFLYFKSVEDLNKIDNIIKDYLKQVGRSLEDVKISIITFDNSSYLVYTIIYNSSERNDILWQHN